MNQSEDEITDRMIRAAKEVGGYVDLMKLGKELGVDVSVMRERAIDTLSKILDERIDRMIESGMFEEQIRRDNQC